MKRLLTLEPVSGGIILSYQRTCECRHCMYAFSPWWRGDWIKVIDLRIALEKFSSKINKRYPRDFKKIGINYGLHFTSGEPFLNFNLLLKPIEIANELCIPATFVKTNCFWCVDD